MFRLQQGGGLAGLNEFRRLAPGVGKRLFIRQIQAEVAGNQRNIIVADGAVALRADNRTEKADMADILDHHFHDAQGNRGFSTAGLGGGDIDITRHRATFRKEANKLKT